MRQFTYTTKKIKSQEIFFLTFIKICGRVHFIRRVNAGIGYFIKGVRDTRIVSGYRLHTNGAGIKRIFSTDGNN